MPQQEAWIVERMGRFHRTLEPGLQILMPFLDRVRYVKSLKEVAIEIPSQSAITQGTVQGRDVTYIPSSKMLRTTELFYPLLFG